MNKQEAKQQIQKLVEKYQRVAETGKIKSYNEAQTRNEFIEPLFEFLGWDMRNLTTDNEVTTEENVSGGRVDLAFRFNGIPALFLEAKAMKVNLDEWKWAEQAINYSWNKSVTWAILTDFESIKIFNAEIPPKSISQNLFIELNCRDFINRFDQLWLLSKESFEQKLLDKEAQKWGKLTLRKQVGEKLFEDLMSWRILLTKDFKKQNNLTDEELDEGVQRILDRLIFVRTAEDRKIEPNVLLGISRGGKANSYKLLTKVFRDFDDGFNSKLFAPHYCEEWKASDKVIAEVINGLYQTKDGYRYDFSVISADVLGGMYEQYLGYVQGRKSEEKQKSTRKSQGIYYTPKYIVDYLIKETLGEVLKKTKPKELAKIKVLDPACGSGSFLTAAYDKILETLVKQNPQTSLFAKFDILKENIFGVDLDAQAVEIAQLNLLLKVLSQKTKLPTLQHNINSGNSLVSGNAEKLEKYFGPDFREQRAFNFEDEFKDAFAQGGFDVIIGNPPYVNLANIKDKNFREYLKNEFKTAKNKSDLYSFFTERAIQLLKSKGKLGFIFSNSWLGTDSFSEFRKYLIENTTVTKLVKLPPGVFNDATVTTILIFLSKEKARENHEIILEEYRDGKFISLPYKLSYKRIKASPNFGFSFNPEIKINCETTRLGKIANFSLGIKTSNDERFISDKKIDKNSYKILRGKDVYRYGHAWNGKWIWYKPELMMQKVGAGPRKLEVFLKNKIFIKDIAQEILATFDTESFLSNDTLSVIYESKLFNIKFLLALLNSKFVNIWYKTNFQSGLHIKINQLQEIPIPKASESEQKDIAEKAQQMLNFNKELQATSANTDKHNSLKREIVKLDQEIDEAIYKLYGLTIKEIEAIQNYE